MKLSNLSNQEEKGIIEFYKRMEKINRKNRIQNGEYKRGINNEDK